LASAAIGGDPGRSPGGPPQLVGEEPRDFRRPGREQRTDHAVALGERGPPLAQERLPVERIFRDDEREGCDADLLRRDAGGGEGRGRCRLFHVLLAAAAGQRRGDNRAPRTAH